MGGNRQTGYNWENNASNAGQRLQPPERRVAVHRDGYKDCGVAGAQFVDFARENKTLGAGDAGDDPDRRLRRRRQEQERHEADKAPSARWVKSLAKKPGALSLTPTSTTRPSTRTSS
jgi:mannan endo-1,4-beta-mannosidase